MEKKSLNWSITKKTHHTISEQKDKNENIIIKRETIMSYMEQFLEDSDIKSNSKKTYFKGLKKFIQWTLLPDNLNESIQLSKKEIAKYKQHLTNANIKPHTQALYLVSLKQFFVWAESNLLLPNIAKNIKGIKKITKQHHKDPLNKDQIDKLLSKSNEFKKKENIIILRNDALISLLLFTGIRVGETTTITIEDIEQINSQKSIIWIKGKGRTGKDNFVVILPETMQKIGEYLFERGKMGETINEKSHLFISHGRRTKNEKLSPDGVSKIINKELKKRNIKTNKTSAHSLRHTFGVNAISAGISLYDLQIAMRHTTPTTTQVYLGDIEKMKRKEGNTEEIIWNYIRKKEEK